MNNVRLLKAHLVYKKISQKDLSEKCNIHYTRLNMYLNGILRLNGEDIKKICKAMKIDFKSYEKNEIKEI